MVILIEMIKIIICLLLFTLWVATLPAASLLLAGQGPCQQLVHGKMCLHDAMIKRP
jgi:hypothetical protein